MRALQAVTRKQAALGRGEPARGNACARPGVRVAVGRIALALSIAGSLACGGDAARPQADRAGASASEAAAKEASRPASTHEVAPAVLPVDETKRAPASEGGSSERAGASPPAAPTTPTVAASAGPLSSEHVGGLRLGMSPVDMQSAVPALTTDGTTRRVTPDSIVPGPLTRDVQEWSDSAGLSVEVHALVSDGIARVASVQASAPSAAKTSRGIGIGATRRAVLKAYPSAITPIDEVWAHTGTDETLIFTFEDGRVHAIILGPAIDPEDLEE